MALGKKKTDQTDEGDASLLEGSAAMSSIEFSLDSASGVPTYLQLAHQVEHRRPQLLVLDEPMASLDPLARHDFMATVMAAVADDGVSVVLSSHALAELALAYLREPGAASLSGPMRSRNGEPVEVAR